MLLVRCAAVETICPLERKQGQAGKLGALYPVCEQGKEDQDNGVGTQKGTGPVQASSGGTVYLPAGSDRRAAEILTVALYKKAHEGFL